jgi:fumarate reductase subunit D
MFNFKGIFQASIRAMILGILLVLIPIILIVVGYVLGSSEEGHLVGLIAEAVSVLMIPVFFVLYLWTGYNARKRYNLKARESGIASALAYGVAAFANLFLLTILSVLKVSDVVGYQISPTIFGFEGIFEDIYVLGTTVCGLGMIAIGMLVNFAVGMSGAILSENRNNSY